MKIRNIAMRNSVSILALTLASTPALAETVQKVSVLVSTGVSYSTGKYGDTRATEVITAPISAKFVRGPISIKVSVPFVHLRGPGTLIDTPIGGASDGGGGGSGNGGSSSSNSGRGSSNSGSGSGNSGSGGGGSGSSGRGGGNAGTGSTSGGNVINPGGTNRSVNGLGDMSVTLTYSFDVGSGIWFDTTAKVKIPSASVRKGLGTGRTDATLQAEAGKDFGPLGVYIGGRRKFAGSNAANPLRNTWGAGGGASYRMSKGASIGLDYDWQQASFVGGRPSSEVTAWTSLRLSKRLNLYLYGLVGTNSGSAEGAGGVSLSYRFD
jgi:hypothetical protein